MHPLAVNRADLSWALNAVLPHVGSPSNNLDVVGFHLGIGGRRALDIYATDRYTTGVASIEPTWDHWEEEVFAPPLDFAVPKREVQDLLRFVRPTLKRHEADTIQLLYIPFGYPAAGYDELHAAILPQDVPQETPFPPQQSSAEPLSEVYWSQVPETRFQAVSVLIDRVRHAHPDTHPDLPFKPDFAARFAKAQRHDTDRLILSPRSGSGYGASFITVGEHFEGAIAGLTYAPRTDASVWSDEAVSIEEEVA